MRPERAPVAGVYPGTAITAVSARAYRIPTERPEADGTLDWDSSTLVVVHLEAGGEHGVGYSFVSRAAVAVIEEMLQPAISGMDAFDIPRCWQAMRRAVRNSGQRGIGACAISAIDTALWDVKAKILGLPLIDLLGRQRNSIAAYGSGGFTTMGPRAIVQQVEHWAGMGLRRYKIKIGRNEVNDIARIRAAAEAMPKDAELFVDANGAYNPKQALRMAAHLAAENVTWFEEPVSSDDVTGLQFVRAHVPVSLDIAAGEYSYNADDARVLLASDAVDILQADATRCLGITGFLQQAQLAAAYHRPLSAHCAPALHAAVMCHAETAVHCEYFSDHARIEQMLFDGIPSVRDGLLIPQEEQPGFGFTFKAIDAETFAL